MMVLIKAKEALIGEVVMVPICYGGNIGPNATSRDGVKYLTLHHARHDGDHVFLNVGGKHDDGTLESGCKFNSETWLKESDLVIAFRDRPSDISDALYAKKAPPA